MVRVVNVNCCILYIININLAEVREKNGFFGSIRTVPVLVLGSVAGFGCK